MEDKILSISEYINLLNGGLKGFSAKIIGEVGEAKLGPTGHMYFTLKDEKDGAMISCIIWAGKYRLFGVKLEQGLKIVAEGCPEIYPKSGRLSFVANVIQLAGEGDLKKQYDLLKKKLTEEGLFALEEKRAVPKYVQKIGVITSKQGAVIHDFLNNIGKHGFTIKMIDSRVEGQGAVEDLLASVKTFRKKDIDVLVLIRGGGSMESLMPFNNELLVREVAGFPVPVIVGIGHDQDVPLVALAADRAESTPTAVANLLNESWEQALLLTERFERKIFYNFGLIFEKYKKAENKIMVAFGSFGNYLENAGLKLRNLLNNNFSDFKNLLIMANGKLLIAEKVIISNNPEKQLKLGYSIAKINGKIIRKVGDAKTGDIINLRVSDGEILSETK